MFQLKLFTFLDCYAVKGREQRWPTTSMTKCTASRVATSPRPALVNYSQHYLIPAQLPGGTALVQDSVGIHSSGQVMFDEKMICGEIWDIAASQVVYVEMFFGNN